MSHGSPTAAAVIDAARAWLVQDPDPETRGELDDLIERATGTDADAAAAASAELFDRFRTRLAFGTAGLRGELGAGSNRMNRVLVAQAAAGLAGYLRQRGERPSVVIGYDGRRNSRVFATDSAEVFAGAGVRAILLPRLLPTPVLAFAVRHLGADAGVMVTASHNPPNDNGYKVYLGGAGAGAGADAGAQIVPPADAEIAACIQRVADEGDVTRLPRRIDYEIAPESVVDAYIEATAGVAPAPTGVAGLRWVYTAMHGVGWETLERIVARAGYPAPVLVERQIAPDGAFPTVAFPNPEEPGAMDLAFETARAAGADLVIANDPDADRLAVAIPDVGTGAGSGSGAGTGSGAGAGSESGSGSGAGAGAGSGSGAGAGAGAGAGSESGSGSGAGAGAGWRRLSGNEIGLLLGWRAARAWAAAGGAATGGAATGGAATGGASAGGAATGGASAGEASAGEDAASLACSLVSSPGLAAIAARYGLGFHATLTGFKWISRAPGIVYGFEEALGYLVNPETVRDKDGISAALAMLELVGEARGRGATVADLLDELAAEIGHFASDQVSLRVDDVSVIARIMAGLRMQHPDRIGDVTVERVDDLLAGVDGLPPGDVLRLWLVDGSRVIVRPSGTEPKLKAYLDVRGDSAADAAERITRLRAGVEVLLHA